MSGNVILFLITTVLLFAASDTRADEPVLECKKLLPLDEVSKNSGVPTIEVSGEMRDGDLVCFYDSPSKPVLTLTIMRNSTADEAEMRFDIFIRGKFRNQKNTKDLEDLGEQALQSQNDLTGAWAVASRKGGLIVLAESFAPARGNPSFLSADQLYLIVKSILESAKPSPG